MTLQPYEQPAHTDSWVPVLAAVGDLARSLAPTKFVPRSMQREPASVAAAILTGREMGLGPMASLRGIDVIEGKPALTAQMLAARILAARHTIAWIESTDTRATVRISRGDGLSEAEATWTKADAERAGLWGKGAWRGYPRHMLRHRALSEAAGMACPDVALGLDVLEGPAEPTDRQTGPTTTVRVDKPAQPQDAPETAPSDEPAPEPETADEPQLVSAAQLRLINKLLTDLERTDGAKLSRDERRAAITVLAEVDRPIDSAKELTSEEASRAIDALRAAQPEQQLPTPN